MELFKYAAGNAVKCCTQVIGTSLVAANDPCRCCRTLGGNAGHFFGLLHECQTVRQFEVCLAVNDRFRRGLVQKNHLYIEEFLEPLDFALNDEKAVRVRHKAAHTAGLIDKMDLNGIRIGDRIGDRIWRYRIWNRLRRTRIGNRDPDPAAVVTQPRDVNLNGKDLCLVIQSHLVFENKAIVCLIRVDSGSNDLAVIHSLDLCFLDLDHGTLEQLDLVHILLGMDNVILQTVAGSIAGCCDRNTARADLCNTFCDAFFIGTDSFEGHLVLEDRDLCIGDALSVFIDNNELDQSKVIILGPVYIFLGDVFAFRFAAFTGAVSVTITEIGRLLVGDPLTEMMFMLCYRFCNGCCCRRFGGRGRTGCSTAGCFCYC